MNRASLLLLLWRFLGLVDLGDTLVVNYPLRVQKHFYTSLFYVGTPRGFFCLIGGPEAFKAGFSFV